MARVLACFVVLLLFALAIPSAGTGAVGSRMSGAFADRPAFTEEARLAAIQRAPDLDADERLDDGPPVGTAGARGVSAGRDGDLQLRQGAAGRPLTQVLLRGRSRRRRESQVREDHA